jgi:ferric iron reductase protein FhuF
MSSAADERIRPIAASFERISGLNLYVDVHPDTEDGAGWIPALALIGEGADDIEGRVRATCASDDPEVLASYALNGYSWPVVMAMVACLALEKRLPDIRLENVAVRFSPEGYLAAIALHSPRFAALPGDPAGDHPDWERAEDREALRDTCRAAIEAHMAPVIAAIRAKMPWGERAMWLTVADRCAGALTHMHHEGLISDEQLIEEIESLVHRKGSKLYSPRTRIAWGTHDGEPCATLERGSCCLAYRLPDSEYCSNCPLKKNDQEPASASG